MILLVTELIFIVSYVNKENVLVVTHRAILKIFSQNLTEVIQEDSNLLRHR